MAGEVLKVNIAGLFEEEFKKHIEGAGDEIKALAEHMAIDGVDAAMLGRQDLVEELGRQTRTLGESMRLRASTAGWKLAGETVRIALLALIRTL